MPSGHDHEVAQLLAIIEMNLAYIEGHPDRQGSEVADALREAREANHKVGKWIREALIKNAT